MRLFIFIGLLFFYSSTAFSSDCDDYDTNDFVQEYLCNKEKYPAKPSLLDETKTKWNETQMPWETNYWECILDEMPGAKTKTVAFAVRKKCNQYGKNYKIEKKSSFFGIKNASECVIEYASDTPSETAAKAIRSACNKLYVR